MSSITAKSRATQRHTPRPDAHTAPPPPAGPQQLNNARALPFGFQEPLPLQDTATFWRTISQVATMAMSVILFGAFLYFARSLLMPIVSALVVSLTLGPVVARGNRMGIPNWVPAISVVLLLVIIFYLAVVLLSDPASSLIAQSAEIGSAIKEKFQFLERPMGALRELQNAVMGGSAALNVNSANVLESFLTYVTPAAAEFLLFYATLFFLLLSRSSFRHSIVGLFSSQDGRLRALKIMNDIEGSLSVYLLTITAINFCLGLVTIAMTYFIGLSAPIIWGALAFVLNYIPYIGPGIMEVALFSMGLLVFSTLAPALIAPLLFMALTFVEGHFITPNIVGRQMTMNALAVFVSLAFWTWLWGPIGAFLGTPILIMANVVMHHLYPSRTAPLPE